MPVALLSEACLRPLNCWDRGFESRSWHGCYCVYCALCR